MQSQPTYKTAHELGIEPWEHAGLIALIGPLSRDELSVNMSHPTFVPDEAWDFGKSHNHFCGTVHCIGGWLAFNHGIRTFNAIGGYVNRGGGGGGDLYKLFYPEELDFSWSNITAPQAAQAIINFLVTGDSRWAKVVGHSK